MFYLPQDPLATQGRRRRLPGLLDGPNMIPGHCWLVRDCVWSSGDALATSGGRRRHLLDLKARRSEVTRITRLSTRSQTNHFENGWVFDSAHRVTRSTWLPFAPPRLEVEQAATTASQGRESAA